MGGVPWRFGRTHRLAGAGVHSLDSGGSVLCAGLTAQGAECLLPLSPFLSFAK